MYLFYDIMDIRMIYVCVYILGCGYNKYIGMCMLLEYRGVFLYLY